MFRTLPASDNPDLEPEEDDPTLEASWPHLTVIKLNVTNYRVINCIIIIIIPARLWVFLAFPRVPRLPAIDWQKSHWSEIRTSIIGIVWLRRPAGAGFSQNSTP